MSYTFSLSRRSLPVRCLCLLLVVLVLWCFFMVPRAGAVATEAATVAYAGALIGTILVGAGVVFSSHGDMQAVGAAMYKSWIKSSNAIGSTISAIASWALEHGEAVAKGALRVGKDMYQAVVDAFNASYSNGKVSLGANVVVLPTDATDAEITAFCNLFANKNVKSFYIAVYSGSADEFVLHTYYTVSGDVYRMVMNNVRSGAVFYDATIDINGKTFQRAYYTLDRDRSFLQVTLNVETRNNTYIRSWPLSINQHLSVSMNPISVSVPQPDLKYPSDDYLVKMPDIPSVDTATGAATFPSDAAYTKDAVAVPYPVDTEGVKVPDIPYDKVVDQSTGKTLDDADTGTDTKPGEGTGEGTETGSGVSGLIGTIIGLLKNFFDSPSDFKLDMDGFRNLAIADKFPFCIPFDMVDSVKQFAATAADYQFRIKFDTQYFSVDHTVDLTPIAVPLAFFRYIVCVWFVWVLMSRTHDLMKW